MKNTEEDIKNKVIIPYLISLGFNINELKFEKSFYIRLGKHSVEVCSNKQIETARPRLDILVTKDGNNLFIIEVKTDSNDLTDEDKKQAISYSRLINPMAPLAVVTNGKNWKIYDTITQCEIDKDKTDIRGYNLNLQDLGHIYDEALEHFIGYSQENVTLFCKEQVEEGMRTLKGSMENPNKKFIPELYVPSRKLYEAFEGFLQSDYLVFAIIGDSGTGKTCSTCGLAIEKCDKYPVLFYKAQDIISDLIESIANDFNWEFSGQSDEISLLKRLNKMFKNIIIFVDGIDEWTSPNKVEGLGNFVSKIKNMNFKIVLSCKSGQWQNFLKSRGSPTLLSEYIYAINKGTPGFFIESLIDEEFYEIVNKYRIFYKFNGTFEREVLEECKRLPLLLRIFFEVAKKTNILHLTFSIKEFYDEYYKIILERLSDNRAEIIIKGCAKALFERNAEFIELDILRKDLNLGVLDQLPESLFECNILTKSSSSLNSRVGFYFSKFRDYVIVYGVEKWDQKSVEDLTNIFSNLDLSDIRLDAVSLFYSLSDQEKKEIIDGNLRVNAQLYLQFYENVISEQFGNLRHRFSPYTSGLIGLLGYLDIKNRKIDACGFIPIKNQANKIIFIPSEKDIWHSNTPFVMGAPSLHWSETCEGFRFKDDIEMNREVLENEIINQLNTIIKNGYLNESSNFYLSLEKVLGIVVKYQKDIHGIKDVRMLSNYLPIEIEKIKYGLRYKKALDYFERELINERIKQGIIKPERKGSTLSYNLSFNLEDRQTIKDRAHEAAISNKEIKIFYMETRKVDNILIEALAAIESMKKSIDETILPDEMPMPIELNNYMFRLPDYEKIFPIIERLFTIYFNEYKKLIETNFINLKNYFILYSQMPLHYFIIPNEYFKLIIYKCRNDYTNNNQTTICKENDIKFNKDDFTLTYNGNIYKVYQVQGRQMNFIYYPEKKFIDIDIPARYSILRTMVYETVMKEFPSVSKQLMKLYGIRTE